ncbi:MAG: hypothetical protein ABI533_10830 [Betaproteobacteria bacterium]
MNRFVPFCVLLVQWAAGSNALAAPTDPPGAAAGQKPPIALVAEPFAALAGSEDNAIALAKALRTGTPATLKAPPDAGTAQATTFAPPTKPMGWGNVSHALELAQHALRVAGIASPSHADLIAALVGGRVIAADGTSSKLFGVLRQRAAGMDWSVIARSYGTTMAAFRRSRVAQDAPGRGESPSAPSGAVMQISANGPGSTTQARN